MNRPALATAVILTAALATAGCGNGQASAGSTGSTGSAGSSRPGTQAYGSLVDLYSTALGGTQCSHMAPSPTTLAKTQAVCDLGSGQQLVLQLWRDSAGRDNGIAQLTADMAHRHLAYCFVTGVGDKALWSVDASENTDICTEVSHRLGGEVVKADGDSPAAARTAASSSSPAGVAG
jgi:hypothetical protein